MSARRDAIRMADEEAYAFLAAQKVGVLGTLGPDGFPHLVNVGFLVHQPGIAFSSFAAAQKVRNLERDPRATFLVEVSWPYNEVRGVMLSGTATIERDTEAVIEFTTRTRAIHARMSGADEGTPDIDIRKHAPKRVLVHLRPDRIRSWDHTRLGGTY